MAAERLSMRPVREILRDRFKQGAGSQGDFVPVDGRALDGARDAEARSSGGSGMAAGRGCQRCRFWRRRLTAQRAPRTAIDAALNRTG